MLRDLAILRPDRWWQRGLVLGACVYAVMHFVLGAALWTLPVMLACGVVGGALGHVMNEEP